MRRWKFDTWKDLKMYCLLALLVYSSTDNSKQFELEYKSALRRGSVEIYSNLLKILKLYCETWKSEP